jgi:SecD/SecF fusion protein
VTYSYDQKAKEYAGGDAAKEYFYLDSLATEKVWFGHTLKECREREINLGLDLKGGMNVTMEVSVPDIIRALSGYNTTENFNEAMKMAQVKQQSSGADFLTLFIESYQEIDPDAKLAAVFATAGLQDKIQINSTNEEVEKIIKAEVDDAISNSFNVLRNRIDRFGVVQPNIQQLSQAGRILIELPGVKEPERVRKLLQGSANLEFWETYELADILPQMMQINNELAQLKAAEAPAAEATEVEEVVEVKDTVYTNILQVLEYIKPGEVTPFEYNSEKIKEIIISRRKQELLLNLQRDILNDALDNNKLKIIEENDKVSE